LKFRLNEEKVGSNVSISWDMIEKDVEREKKIRIDFQPIIPKPFPLDKFIGPSNQPEPIKPWWKFWQR